MIGIAERLLPSNHPPNVGDMTKLNDSPTKTTACHQKAKEAKKLLTVKRAAQAPPTHRVQSYGVWFGL
jgi:hypothetical protein